MTNVNLTQLKEALNKQKEEIVTELLKQQEKSLEKQKQELLSEFEKLKLHFLQEIDSKYENFNSELQDVKNMADRNANEILRLNQSITTIVGINKDQAKQISDLNERVEKRTNRQMRNTLIFKGIPKIPSEEKKGQEAWQYTRQALVSAISSHIDDLDETRATRCIERVHRGKPNEHGKQAIYAKIFDWNICEKLKHDFRSINIADNSVKIYCEQMFGPLTSARRNHALSVRKQLKEEGKIYSGFVVYPAKLLVKVTRDPKGSYIEHEDYSKMEVNFKKPKS